MRYVYSQNANEATNQLAAAIREKLAAGKKVLWFVSGGSGADVSVEVAKVLKDADLTNLSVTLSDERYGPVGHPDENWQQLLDKGFAVPGATTYRTLIGKNRDETTQAFEDWVSNTADSADYVIGLFGIGPDGHTAGVKPHTGAVLSTSIATEYAGEDFERITITPAFIETIDEAVTQAFGEDKHSVIRQLLDEHVPLTDQPAQILKSIPKSALYSDYKEVQEENE